MNYAFLITLVIMSFFSTRAIANDILILNNPKLVSCSQLSSSLKQLLENHPKKKFVFYVHGRGKYPERAYNYLHKFESKYDAITATFIWDAWTGLLSRPHENAIEAAPRLLNCLMEFKKFKEENPEVIANRSVHLLLHSMGNVILKEIVEKYFYDELPFDLFDTVVINSADVPSKNHKIWLSKVRLSPRLYVTINAEDAVLNASNVIDLSSLYTRRLGAYVDDPYIPSTNSEIEVSYLDFDKITFLGHRHFLIQEDSKDRYVNQIFRHIFDLSLGDYPVNNKKSDKFPNLWYFYPD